MTRWIFDLLRLSAFCGLFLFAATSVLAGEDEPDKEERSIGLKIEFEDGELKIERTGDADLDELPAMLEGKLAEVVEQLAENGDVQVKVQALVEDAGEMIKDLPIEEMLKAIKSEIAGEIEANVEVQVEVDESQDGERRVEIRKIVTGGDEDEILDVIKDLKQQGENIWVEKLGDGGKQLKMKMMFIPDGRDMPRATHRLGIAISSTAGVMIHEVGDDSAADAAGLKAGDILLAVDGENVGGIGELVAKVNDAGQDGRELKLTIVRGDDLMFVMAEPKEIEHDHDEGHDHHHGHHHGHDDDHDGDDDHEHHEHDDDHDHDHDHDHEHALEQTRDHARAMAERAAQMKMRVQEQVERGQQAHREAMQQAEREMKARARDMERRARELRRERDSISSLKKEMQELREMVKELKAAIEDEE